LYYGGQKYYYAITKKKPKEMGKHCSHRHMSTWMAIVFSLSCPLKKKKTLPSV